MWTLRFRVTPNLSLSFPIYFVSFDTSANLCRRRPFWEKQRNMVTANDRYDVVKTAIVLFLRLCGGSELAYRLWIQAFLARHEAGFDKLFADLQPRRAPVLHEWQEWPIVPNVAPSMTTTTTTPEAVAVAAD